MKIGIFDPYLDDLGGGERYMMTIAKCLSKNNDVEIFWDQAKDLRMIEERFSLDLSNITLNENIFKYDLIRKQKIAKKFDLILVLSDGSIPIVASKKLYLHMQQPISYKLSIKDKFKLKRINGIFCNSEFTRDFIQKNYKVKCNLLYPPVSIYGNKTKKENIIFHVGRFRVLNVKVEDYKKQQTMINTFKKIVDKGLKNWKFLLAVSLNDLEDPKFLSLKKSAVGYPVEFLINASNEELWKNGSKAKIYWHATGFGENINQSPQLAEHFGISTVEAMGVGAVPVVINAGGQKEIVTDGVDGFLWDDLNEFENKTLKLIRDEKLLNKMSERAFRRSKYFDEGSFCKRVQEIIK